MVTQIIELDVQQQDVVIVMEVCDAGVCQCETLLKQMLVNYIKKVLFKPTKFHVPDNTME